MMKTNYSALTVILLITLLATVTQHSWAQTKLAGSKITGVVVDDQKKPLDFATVLLLRSSDSSMVKTSMTDLEGKYLLENLPSGEYIITVTMVGYKKVKSKPFKLDASSPSVQVEQLQTGPDSKNLKEVSIVAQKPFIERKMDKLVMNVENSSVSAGSTAMEVLEKAPGVTVDKDDNISMKGKQGVLIMLDGKQTYMSSADVANMLRNMQSNQIESIELITSPSARYDAAGTSGIINIKTKKSKSMGLNGTLTGGTGYGQTSKYQGGTTLNYRQGKINAFGNYNYANNGRMNNLDLNRVVTYEDTVTNFTQLNDWDNRRLSNSFKTGVDLFIDKNHTIGVLANGYFNRNEENSNSNTARSNNFNQAEDISIVGTNTEKYQNMAYNLNYKGTLDSSGKELSVDLDYSDYKSNHDEIRDNLYTATNIEQRDRLFVKNYAPSSIDVKSIKIDYTHPLSKTTKFEAGIKSSVVKTDNDLLLARLEGEAWIPDADYSNRFLYDENINAAYLNFSKEFKKFGLQFGLRAEQTFSKGNSITKNEIVERDYIKLFPSLSLSHTVNKNHQLGFSFSRRIDRPSYDNLNPFMNFLDEYTFQKGNPYLNPQFTSSFDISHTYKGSITTSLSYSHTVDVMTTVTEQEDETLKTFAIERNLDEQDVYALSVFAPIPVQKWWNINNNLQLFHMGFKSKSDEGDLDAGQFAMTYNMDHSFTLDKTFTAELSAQYQSPLQYGIFKIESQLVMNAGLRKSFWDNKMNVRLSMNDLFNTRTQHLSTTYQNMNLNFTEKGESQVARITLTYRFGKNEVKAARRRSTGLEDEANRMKN
ncbi:TonB-dependent receptor [Flavihumibacter sp. R14]|nr:TonB-dependent receptor [Flavihumibacter soli]